MNIDFESVIRKLKSKAESTIADNSKLNKLISKTIEILNKNSELESIINDIKLLVQLIKDYINHTYRNVSKNSIIMIIISLIYLVNPLDLIPDFLVGGFLDDAAVIVYVVKKIQMELNHYKEWKVNIIDEDDGYHSI